ncbi:MAG: hypothetical protein JO182_06125 [Acidobacteriaceae bacterium]|nr:hypothetical protein [Acidobacteriaceae bacterium]MBV9034052.1 hypothetical protein [Acidobacteriaceae bacterium]MBV9675127.1 hypothetical protein [Acidobacteriaceae bacterium]MBV9937568.1 hypothetical protein [Acidobacteriaceae bacterium]
MADHLSRRERRKPKQASLRRAISTAYYALFHLLIEEATKRWSGHKDSRIGLARAFEHTNMDKASKAFQKSNWQGFDDNNVAIPSDLQKVALAFTILQAERHRADYSYAARFTRAGVRGRVKQAQRAFEHWAAVKNNPAADYYLVALLTGNRRRD